MKSKISISFAAIFIMLSFVTSSESHADTIILKNGRSIVVDMAWEEGDYIRGLRIKNTIGFHKDSVEKVIYKKNADSFIFDIWTGGITLSKAIEIAQSYDIPINAAGVISSATKFNSSVRNYINSAENFYYKTKFMGESGEITLCFTSVSRLLYKVVVHLHGVGINRKGKYRDEIETMLTNKYGKPDKSLGAFGDRLNWNVNNQYAINLVIGVAGIDIIYSDNALEKKTPLKKSRTRMLKNPVTQRKIPTIKNF